MKAKKKLKYFFENFSTDTILFHLQTLNWWIVYDALICCLTLPLVLLMLDGESIEVLSNAYIIKNVFVFCLISLGLLFWSLSGQGFGALFSFQTLSGVSLFSITSCALFYPCMLLLAQTETLPLITPVIHCISMIVSFSTPRLVQQLREYFTSRDEESAKTPIVLFVAGQESYQIYKEWSLQNLDDYTVTALATTKPELFEDDLVQVPLLSFKRVDELVFGLRDEKIAPERIFLLPSELSSTMLRGFFKQFFDLKIPVLKLIKNFDTDFAEPRPLLIEDILGFHPFSGRRVLDGKRILITGAGGHLGAAFAKFVGGLFPDEIILVDHYEQTLAQTESELEEAEYHSKVTSYLTSTYDKEKITEIFETHSPDIVFHAAAVNNSRLANSNPLETIRTNLLGTAIVSEVAGNTRTSAVILPSTSQSSHKDSLLGATKHINEILFKARHLSSPLSNMPTRYIAIRMGEIFGSTGTLIPKLRQQVSAGGPVNLMHPELMRYFMTADRAFSLILELSDQLFDSSFGKSTYVLDMGEPLRVLDVVEDMIRLHGKTPHQDIKINFTGLPEGDLLFEEPFHSQDSLQPSAINGVLETQIEAPDYGLILKLINNLEKELASGNLDKAYQIIRLLVPEFGSQEHKQEVA